jgi:Fe-S cluster biosynthesis and repair protein YggX
MAQRMVKCEKLSQELPGIDESTNEGEAAMVMVRSLGDEVLAKKVYENISQEAWKMWVSHMTMVINEYRLDPASPDADDILKQQMKDFFFGEGAALPPGYVPPQGKA